VLENAGGGAPGELAAAGPSARQFAQPPLEVGHIRDVPVGAGRRFAARWRS